MTIAGVLDHLLVRPELTHDEVWAGCELARERGVACAIVRPYDIDLAVRALEGSAVRPGSVCGFPHGTSSTATKLYEARDLLRRGAREIDSVLNIGQLRSRQFRYVESELRQLAEACHESGAKLKVILETASLTQELKIVACQTVARASVDILVARPGDLELLRAHLPETIGLAAPAQTLEEAKQLLAAGCVRIGTTQTRAILDARDAATEPL